MVISFSKQFLKALVTKRLRQSSIIFMVYYVIQNCFHNTRAIFRLIIINFCTIFLKVMIYVLIFNHTSTL